MEILGIGPTELVFIILIAIIVLGPREMEKTGRMIGRWLNQVRTSEWWKIVQDTSRDLSNLPNKWMREANLDMWEAQKDLNRMMDAKEDRSAPTRRQSLPLPDEPEHTIQPPPAADLSQTPPIETSTEPPDKHD